MKTSVKPKGVVNTNVDTWEYVFRSETRAALHGLLDFDESLIPACATATEASPFLKGGDVMLASWNSRPLSTAVLDASPDLKLVVYAAGSVKELVTPVVAERGIIVCSAVHLNAQPVAEFTLGLVLTALKRVHSLAADLRTHGPAGWHVDGPTFTGGYYGTRVGLLGYGRITERLLQLLKPFEFEVLLNDSHLTQEQIVALGANPATMREIMETCDVVSLHHGNTAENRHLINDENLAVMKSGSTLINTARGALVDEDALIRRLRCGDITAYLDVTDPEPPPPGHPFYTLPNCVMTPHIAGSLGREVHRMGDYALREVRNWLEGAPLENEVDLATVGERG